MDLAHVKDFEHLRSIATVQQAQIRHLIEALRQKCKELEAFKGEGELQRTLALLEELESKARSEPRPESESEPDTSSDTERRRSPQHGHGPTKQLSLPHIVATHTLPEEERGCSACGGQLEELEGQYETSELIDVVDVEYRVIQQRRQKYVCRCGGQVKTAGAPEPAVCGGRYSVAFAVKVAVDKYLHHLPLARQVRMMTLRGLEVRSQTLWDQVEEIASKLESSWEALLRRALAQAVIGVDQTGWPNLERKKHKKWQMWCITTPDVVYHTIRDDKGTDTFLDLLGRYAGVVVCDDLKTHGAGARENPSLQLAGCWAHYLEHSLIRSRAVLEPGQSDLRRIPRDNPGESHRRLVRLQRYECGRSPRALERRASPPSRADLGRRWHQEKYDCCLPALGAALPGGLPTTERVGDIAAHISGRY